MADLKDRHIVVTGAGDGIGRGIATTLASHGVHVYAISRTQANLDSLKSEYPAINIKCMDITDYEGIQEYIGSLPPLDGLVNNAAIGMAGPFLEFTPEDYDTLMDVNVKANYFVAQAAAKNMVKHSHPGSIILLSSQASQVALPGHSLYGMSKAALDNLAKNMALELGVHGIRVNCINPTVVMTNMGKIAWSAPEKAKPLLDRMPLGRFAEIEDVVGPVLFLLSDHSAMVNGTALPVDGGYLAT